MSYVVVVDIDGVLAQFSEKMVELMGPPVRDDTYSLEAWWPGRGEEIRRLVTDPETYRDLKPIEEARPVLEWMKEKGFQVVAVTARPESAEMEAITWAWLRRNFPGVIQSLSVVNTKNKPLEVASYRPELAIDDSPEQVQGALDLGVNAILLRRTYNYEEGRTLASVEWLEVPGVLQDIDQPFMEEDESPDSGVPGAGLVGLP